MNGLLEYSGLSTKLKAMKAKLLTEEDFIFLEEQKDISGIAVYLSKKENYRDIFAGENEEAIRRHRFEELVRTTLYTDYKKVYRFSHMEQKQFLKAYFMKYEIAVIKRTLRKCFGTKGEITDRGYVYSQSFEDKCSFDVKNMMAANSVDEVVGLLYGTVYYDLLNILNKKDDTGLFDYESVLDIFYFKALWKAGHKSLSKKDLLLIERCFGEEIDLINLEWIYRAKKYYTISPAQIYSLVIPIFYKLRKQDIIYLIKTDTEEDFLNTISKLPYIKKSGDILLNQGIESIYEERMEKIHKSDIKKNPNSIACVVSYFYQKEKEIERLVRTIENVRYSVKV